MLLSALQRLILRECYQFPKPRVPRETFTTFYKKNAPIEIINNGITVSMERLIDRGLLICYGRRTPKKWYIEEVKLTPFGRKIAKQSFGKQLELAY